MPHSKCAMQSHKAHMLTWIREPYIVVYCDIFLKTDWAGTLFHMYVCFEVGKR